MSVGKCARRVDAYEKVTGRAKYTEDLAPTNALVAKVVRSTIANGLVLKFDLTAALKVPGIVKILTCFDCPQLDFSTAGNPWSLDPEEQKIADRKLLNRRVRIYGDDIAVVIAENEIAAVRATRLIRVEYEEYPTYVDVKDAMDSEGKPIHDLYPDNIFMRMTTELGESAPAETIKDENLIRLARTYDTQVVQHCHIELPVSHAWMDSGRITVVTSTQIPHIVRRVISKALDIPFGRIRVIKPYIGGGFGNKQDVLYEPLNAWLTTQVGGRCVKLELSREETMTCTRTRHAIRFSFASAISSEGRLVTRKIAAYNNLGGYASHAVAVLSNAAKVCQILYQDAKTYEFDGYMVYTNLPSGGAMRGYGIPQAVFALESHIDDLAAMIGKDPIEMRTQNFIPGGFEGNTTAIPCHSCGMSECIQRGRDHIEWDKKRKAYQNQDGPVRRGVGMAIFCFKTGVHPYALETASTRIVMNQDGTVQIQMGATEIGQGADTVFTQMASETIGIPMEMINIVSAQDTDVSPFDTGAYASRQSYVSGMALKQTSEIFKEKLLSYAAEVLEYKPEELDIREGNIVDRFSGEIRRAVADIAIEAFYSLNHSQHITAESTHQCKDNTLAFGVCFAEVEVDIPVGKVKILNIINVHDSGRLLNPQLAQAQVHGGMSMAIGYALGEQLLFDEKAKPLNGNLLDYKLPTSMDTPELVAGFVEIPDPTGPYGNKALGEPPAIPGAAAIRNAIFHATGVGISSLPLNPQKLVEAFTEAGLISTGDAT